MADSKISALTDGSPLQATDEFVIARGAADYKIPGSAVGIKLYDSGYLTASQASIDTGAGAIPTGFSEIEVIYYARGDKAAVDDVGILRFNADSGGNYNWRKILLNNTSISGQSQTAQTGWETLWPAASAAAHIFGIGRLTILGYDSGQYPAVESHYGGLADNAASSYMVLSQGWYASTTAISRVSIAPSSGNLVAGSRLIVRGKP